MDVKMLILTNPSSLRTRLPSPRGTLKVKIPKNYHLGSSSFCTKISAIMTPKKPAQAIPLDEFYPQPKDLCRRHIQLRKMKCDKVNEIYQCQCFDWQFTVFLVCWVTYL